MSKQCTRTCDICAQTHTKRDDQDFSNAGWTELRYTFGSSINSFNSIIITKDVCPTCAEEIGMVQFKDNPNSNGEKRLIRPSKENIVKKELEPTIEDHFREFIVQIGNDEGWYKNE